MIYFRTAMEPHPIGFDTIQWDDFLWASVRKTLWCKGTNKVHLRICGWSFSYIYGIITNGGKESEGIKKNKGAIYLKVYSFVVGDIAKKQTGQQCYLFCPQYRRNGVEQSNQTRYTA